MQNNNNIREKLQQCFVADPLHTLKAMRDAGVDHNVLRQLAKRALEVHDLKVNYIIRGVIEEIYREDPAKFTWSVKKGLSPGFRLKEIVNFTDNGRTRKGQIEKIGLYGASIKPLYEPGVIFQVPGSRIMKSID